MFCHWFWWLAADVGIPKQLLHMTAHEGFGQDRLILSGKGSLAKKKKKRTQLQSQDIANVFVVIFVFLSEFLSLSLFGVSWKGHVAPRNFVAGWCGTGAMRSCVCVSHGSSVISNKPVIGSLHDQHTGVCSVILMIRQQGRTLDNRRQQSQTTHPYTVPRQLCSWCMTRQCKVPGT